jgi:hypothetical protein
MKERGYTIPHRIRSARQGRTSTGANDAAVAEPAEDIEEVNMDDRVIGKLQSDVEYIKSDVVIVLLVLTLMSSAPGAVATLLKLL